MPSKLVRCNLFVASLTIKSHINLLILCIFLHIYFDWLLVCTAADLSWRRGFQCLLNKESMVTCSSVQTMYKGVCAGGNLL